MADDTEIQSDYSLIFSDVESVSGEHSVYLYRSGRRESICLAESSVSSESSSKIDELSFALSCKTSTVDDVTEYSAEFNSEESSNQTESIEFVKKKLQVLNSKKSDECDGECDEGSKIKQPGQLIELRKPLCLKTLAFCDKKIQQLQGYSSRSRGAGPWPIHHYMKTEPSDEKVNLVWHGSMAKIESLKIENLLSKMAKSSNVAQHNPGSCTGCRKQRSKLARVDFLKRKLEVLKRPVFEARLENHLYGRDGTTLLAEIINSGPKPGDHPEEIWDRLLKQTSKQDHIEQ